MKIEQKIDLLTQTAADIKSILAVHDEKITTHEKQHDATLSLIEQRRTEMADDIKELHSRITTVQRELSTDIATTETRILSSIEDIKKELTADQEFHNKRQKTLEERIMTLENWRYILLGAGIAGGFFLTKFSSMFEIVIK